jgi:predicted O-linked N-acetylglucosamine transferase (SPINDLY family)
VIDLWSEMLRTMPDARLIIAAAGLERMADVVASRFTARGVDRRQIEVIGRQSLTDYLALHRRIDINLDTFPYSGGTTTCHSLWMGVPVLTLPGESMTSRGGASLLSTLGLNGFIASSAREYIDIALRASEARGELAGMRAGLRQRMRESPLMDGARFTRNMEAAYRFMWQERISGGRT